MGPYGILPDAGNWWCPRLGWGHLNKPNSNMFRASSKFNHHPTTHNSQLPIKCPRKSILLHVCLLICHVLGFLDGTFAFHRFSIFLVCLCMSVCSSLSIFFLAWSRRDPIFSQPQQVSGVLPLNPHPLLSLPTATLTLSTSTQPPCCSL